MQIPLLSKYFKTSKCPLRQARNNGVFWNKQEFFLANARKLFYLFGFYVIKVFFLLDVSCAIKLLLQILLFFYF